MHEEFAVEAGVSPAINAVATAEPARRGGCAVVTVVWQLLTVAPFLDSWPESLAVVSHPLQPDQLFWEFLIETRSLPALARRYHRDFALITRTARCLRQLPSCVAVYPRESRSRRVLCRISHKLHFSFLLHPSVAEASQSEQTGA
jgi:hypothetical protein